MNETREVADGVFAYLQQGSWGYSNAGLVKGGGASLLVDTLYDLRLTEHMLKELERITGTVRFDTVVNTHANGDHCWGNQLVGDAELISSRATAEEMLELSPKLMHTLVQASRAIVRMGGLASVPLRLLGQLGIARAGALADAAPLLVERFGDFDFGAVSLRVPTRTFEGRLNLRVGDSEVQLIEVGPAHTRGDVIVYLPRQRVVFSGDILFIDTHPIVWDGPIDNWIAACDVMLGLDVDVIVPGHGPLTDKRGVQQTKDYWLRVQQLAAQAPAEQAAAQLRAEFAWTDAERAIANVISAQRQLGVESSRDPLAVLARMATSLPPG
jgi:cyclase